MTSVSVSSMQTRSPTFHAFIRVFISIYPFTGTTQGCGDGHNVIYNISFELQMS